MLDTKTNTRLNSAGIKTEDLSTIQDQIEQKIAKKTKILQESPYSKNPQDFKQDLKEFGIEPPADVSLISKKDLSDLKKKVDAEMATTIIKSVALDRSREEDILKESVQEREVSDKETIAISKEIAAKYEINSLTDKSLFPEHMQGDDFASKLCGVRADEAWRANPASASTDISPAQKLVQGKIIADAVAIGEKVRKLEGISDFLANYRAYIALNKLQKDTEHLRDNNKKILGQHTERVLRSQQPTKEGINL